MRPVCRQLVLFTFVFEILPTRKIIFGGGGVEKEGIENVLVEGKDTVNVSFACLEMFLVDGRDTVNVSFKETQSMFLRI